MPNWMRHALEISGDKKQVEKFFNTIGDGFASEQPINFEKIIPPPANLFRGNLGKEEEEYCKANNIPDWYSWNRENWGTKWNAAYGETKFNEDGDRVLFFDTAWAVPIPILERIEEMVAQDFPKIKIYGEFLEEGYQSGGFFTIDASGGSVHSLDVGMDYDENTDDYTTYARDEHDQDFKFKYV